MCALQHRDVDLRLERKSVEILSTEIALVTGVRSASVLNCDASREQCSIV